MDVVRRDADWMTRADGRILEYLAFEGSATPTELAADDRLRFSRQHLGNRCREFLVPYGLVEDRGDGRYAITETGRRYLDGDVDAADLQPDRL